MPITSSVFAKYPNTWLIETGSYFGDGIQSALNAGFTKIRSIELGNKFYNHCKERFKDNPNVELFQGDSAFDLYNIIQDIKEPMTIWLDGHCSAGDTACGKYWSPLIQELEQIKQHSHENNLRHTILADDKRCWLVKQNKIDFDINDIIANILAIDKNYRITYEDGFVPDDIIVAHI
jgi:hypothetical protein